MHRGPSLRARPYDVPSLTQTAAGGGAVVLLAFVAKIQLCAWQLWAQVLLGLGIAIIDLFVGSHSIWYEEGLPIVVGLSTAFLAGAQAGYLPQTLQFMKIRGSAGVASDCWKGGSCMRCAAFQRSQLALITWGAKASGTILTEAGFEAGAAHLY